MKLFIIFTIITFSLLANADLPKKRLSDTLRVGVSHNFAIKCMKNGESALSSGDSNNFNIAEFNGEFKESEIEYWTEDNNKVSKKILSTEQIVDITPINDKGCFLIKYSL